MKTDIVVIIPTRTRTRTHGGQIEFGATSIEVSAIQRHFVGKLF